MKSLCIVTPSRPVAANGFVQTGSRLFSPDPKEAIIVTGGTGVTINMDFGAPVSFDSAFLGYHTGSASSSWSVQTINDAQNTVTGSLMPAMPARAPGFGPVRHGFYQAAAPLTSRWWQVSLADPGPDWLLGVFALGISWSSKWGQEMGAGRQIIDTGSVERLFGGGFGIDEGARAGSYQWTFGDLQADEIRSLYQIVKDRGATRTVLVVEDPENTDGLNERIHWGLFDKLDFYERSDPTNWRWNLKISDWA